MPTFARYAKAFLAAAGALPPAVVGAVLEAVGVHVNAGFLAGLSTLLAILAVRFGPANTPIREG